ncbi:MAG TPA: hypothetical protein VFR67_02205, partial [Pilimelia sp.]|nr:hypothetical protein [Pilimelia sp.]
MSDGSHVMSEILDWFWEIEQWIPGIHSTVGEIIFGQIPLSDGVRVYELAEAWSTAAQQLGDAYEEARQTAQGIIESWSGDGAAMQFADEWFRYLEALSGAAESAAGMAEGANGFGLQVELMKFMAVINLIMLAVSLIIIIATLVPSLGTSTAAAPGAVATARAGIAAAANAAKTAIANLTLRSALRAIPTVAVRALPAAGRAVPVVLRAAPRALPALGRAIPAAGRALPSLARSVFPRVVGNVAPRRVIARSVADRLAAQALGRAARRELAQQLGSRAAARAVRSHVARTIESRLLANMGARQAAQAAASRAVAQSAARFAGNELMEAAARNAVNRAVANQLGGVVLRNEVAKYLGVRVAFGAGFLGGGDLLGQSLQVLDGNRTSVDLGHTLTSAAQGAAFGLGMWGGVGGHILGGAAAGGLVAAGTGLATGTFSWTEVGHGAVHGGAAGAIFGAQNNLEIMRVNAPGHVGSGIRALPDGLSTLGRLGDVSPAGTGATRVGDGGLRVDLDGVPGDLGRLPDADGIGVPREPDITVAQPPDPVRVTADPVARVPVVDAPVREGMPARPPGDGGGGPPQPARSAPDAPGPRVPEPVRTADGGTGTRVAERGPAAPDQPRATGDRTPPGGERAPRGGERAPADRTPAGGDRTPAGSDGVGPAERRAAEAATPGTRAPDEAATPGTRAPDDAGAPRDTGRRDEPVTRPDDGEAGRPRDAVPVRDESPARDGPPPPDGPPPHDGPPRPDGPATRPDGEALHGAGAERGEDPSPHSIEQGTVRMEEHPDYPRVMQEISDLGFTVAHTTGDPNIHVLRVIDPDGAVVRVEHQANLRPGMRFLDLEHELGHIHQLTDPARFPNGPPAMREVTELPDGRQRTNNSVPGLLRGWRIEVAEYHVRLQEFIRLAERGVDADILRAHWESVVDHAADHQRSVTRRPPANERPRWTNQHFPDIPELEARARELAAAMRQDPAGPHPPAPPRAGGGADGGAGGDPGALRKAADDRPPDGPPPREDALSRDDGPPRDDAQRSDPDPEPDAATGGSIRPRDEVRAWEWAEQAYERFRADDNDVRDMAGALSDVERPSGRVGFTPDEIGEVKRHLMVDEHLISDYEGGFTRQRFDASPGIAEAWIRLREGRHLDADLILLEHELAEAAYAREHPDATYPEAHAYANERYNWEIIEPQRTGEDLRTSWGREHPDGDTARLPEGPGRQSGGGIHLRLPGEDGPPPGDREGVAGGQPGGRDQGFPVRGGVREDPALLPARGDLAGEGVVRRVGGADDLHSRLGDRTNQGWDSAGEVHGRGSLRGTAAGADPGGWPGPGRGGDGGHDIAGRGDGSDGQGGQYRADSPAGRQPQPGESGYRPGERDSAGAGDGSHRPIAPQRDTGADDRIPHRLVAADPVAVSRVAELPDEVATAIDRHVNDLLDGARTRAADLPHRATWDPASGILTVEYPDGVRARVVLQVNSSLPPGHPVVLRPAMDFVDGAWRQSEPAGVVLPAHAPPDAAARADLV